MKIVLAVLAAWVATTQTVSVADCACTICTKPGECGGCAEERPAKPDCCKDRPRPSRCTHLDPSPEVIADPVDLPAPVASDAEPLPDESLPPIASGPRTERPAGIARGRPLYLLHSVLLI